MRRVHYGARTDLSHVRPWKAVPMDPKEPDGPWKVIAPSKTSRPNDWAEVVSFLSEEDAKSIAASSSGEIKDIPY